MQSKWSGSSDSIPVTSPHSVESVICQQCLHGIRAAPLHTITNHQDTTRIQAQMRMLSVSHYGEQKSRRDQTAMSIMPPAICSSVHSTPLLRHTDDFLLDQSRLVAVHPARPTLEPSSRHRTSGTTKYEIRTQCRYPGCYQSFTRRANMERIYRSVHLKIRSNCLIPGCDNNNGKGLWYIAMLKKHLKENHWP